MTCKVCYERYKVVPASPLAPTVPAAPSCPALPSATPSSTSPSPNASSSSGGKQKFKQLKQPALVRTGADCLNREMMQKLFFCGFFT